MSQATKSELESLFQELKNAKNTTTNSMHELGTVYGELVLAVWSVHKNGFNEKEVSSKEVKEQIDEIRNLRTDLNDSVRKFRSEINRVVFGENPKEK